MARPKSTDTSHRVLRNCTFCCIKIVVPLSRAKYSKSYCTKTHMILDMKARSFRFPCVICNKLIFTQPAQIKYRHRTTCSTGCRSKLARKRADERRVTLGYTKHQLDRLARYSPEANEWRKKIFTRDNYTCQMCGKIGGYLEADHIKPWAYFPDLRFELSNGRTLCRPCHNTTKLSAKKMREIYAQDYKDLILKYS